jgi:succinate dehydrogenase / fumarate reductase iron-sulfur subunit
MQTTEAVFRISRFNPERDEKSRYDTFQVSIDNRMTVLDALQEIKHTQDASLAFRRSCRSGICGSCAMRINGLAKLACKTRAATEFSKHGEVLVEPMENMGVVRDLVVDMGEFWHELYRGKPWLVGEAAAQDLSKENVVAKEQLRVSDKLADCIMCGACFSNCVSRVFDKNFAGPASLAKVARFVADPRDKAERERIGSLVGLGLWSCTHCYFCWSQCPRDVRPVAAISLLRERSVGLGDGSRGARHVKVFSDSVRKSGMLNEAMLYLKTARFGVVKDVGFMVQMARKGKAPSPFMRPIPKVEEIQRLYRSLAKEARKE